MQAAKLREAAREGEALESAALDEVAAELAAGPSEKFPEDGKAGTWHTTDTMAFIDSLNTLEATAEDQVRYACCACTHSCCFERVHAGFARF